MIDPSLTRAFVRGVEQARTHAESAGAAVRELGTAPAPQRAVELVDAAAMELDFMAGALQSARREVSTHAAADGARELAVERHGDLRRGLDALRGQLAAGDAHAGSEALVGHVERLQAGFQRLVGWDLDEVARRATSPAIDEDATLGALADGGWRSLGQAADDALLDASRTIDDEQRAVVDQLQELGRVSRDDVEALGASLDDEIAADDFARQLARLDDDFVARLADGEVRPTAEAIAAGLRGVADEVHGDLLPARPPKAGAAVTVSGEGGFSTAPPAAGDHVLTLLLGHEAHHGSRARVEVPLEATGRWIDFPTFDAAHGAVVGRGEESWSIVPRAGAGWRAIETLSAPGDDVAANIAEARRRSMRVLGVREANLRVQGLVTVGTDVPLRPTDSDLALREARRALERFDGSELSRAAHIGRLDERLPAAGTELAKLDVPGSTLHRPKTITMTLADRPVVLVEGTRADALRELHALVRGLHDPGARALVQVDAGTYGVVDVNGLDARQVRRLIAANDPEAVRISDPRVVAITMGYQRMPATLTVQ